MRKTCFNVEVVNQRFTGCCVSFFIRAIHVWLNREMVDDHIDRELRHAKMQSFIQDLNHAYELSIVFVMNSFHLAVFQAN